MKMAYGLVGLAIVVMIVATFFFMKRDAGKEVYNESEETGSEEQTGAEVPQGGTSAPAPTTATTNTNTMLK